MDAGLRLEQYPPQILERSDRSFQIKRFTLNQTYNCRYFSSSLIVQEARYNLVHPIRNRRSTFTETISNTGDDLNMECLSSSRGPLTYLQKSKISSLHCPCSLFLFRKRNLFGIIPSRERRGEREREIRDNEALGGSGAGERRHRWGPVGGTHISERLCQGWLPAPNPRS